MTDDNRDDLPVRRRMTRRTRPPHAQRRPPITGRTEADDFEVHTYDSDQLDTPPAPPEETAWDAVSSFDDAVSQDDAAYDDGASSHDGAPSYDGDDDDFVLYTVEPEVASRGGSAGVALPLQRQGRAGSGGRATRARTRQRSASNYIWLHTLRTLIVVLAAALLVSTIFSLWTRPTFFTEEFRVGLNRVQATYRLQSNVTPTRLPTEVHEVRVGIIAGHSGSPKDTTFETDPGAVCPDGLTELEINVEVARQAVGVLQREGYSVDLLEEFDPRLNGYSADVLVSIHTNDCSDYGAAGTGFSVASASGRQTTPGTDELLLECLVNQYGATTGLPRHYGTTYDMTDYHTFSEVASDTPTAIIEIGFMRNNRTILTTQQGLLAQGVANGVRCFLRPELFSN